jgi:RNA polymerase sigma factor (sigma-70 family)
MDAVLADALNVSEQDRLIALTVQRERGRLLKYIRRRIADAAEADDILQETFSELVLAYRLTQPIAQAGAWLLRVARNRIIDRFRRVRTRGELSWDAAEEGDTATLAALLPAPAADPQALAVRAALLDEIERALSELPPEQRAVFVAHELEGVSFRDLAARSGVSVNTLLSRKHYAVRYLRNRLRAAWNESLST